MLILYNYDCYTIIIFIVNLFTIENDDVYKMFKSKSYICSVPFHSANYKAAYATVINGKVIG